MANQKITQLTELTAVDKSDIMYIVDDPAGTPTSKKTTVENVLQGTNTLDNNTTVAGTDILLIIDDPSGTPVAEKRTVAQTVGSVGLLKAGGTMDEAGNIALGTTTGSKIGTATDQKLGFWNATPVVQQTTSVAEAAFSAESGTAVNDNSTFGGYTLQQVVKALQIVGILA